MSKYRKYSVSAGVIRIKTVNIKIIIIGSIATLAAFGAMAAPVFAAPNNYCGSSANGCSAAAAAGAQCGTGASSGSFGAFGPGNNWAGGANGVQTGLNNSGVCGNRQGNL
jgi:hypothetical protein